MLYNVSYSVSLRKKQNVTTRISFAINVESQAIRQNHITKEYLRKGYIGDLDR